MRETKSDKGKDDPRDNRNLGDNSPDPTEVLRYLIRWFRGFHLHREKPKVTDWVTVVLTLAVAGAAICSAWIFQKQLNLERGSFIAGQRAYVNVNGLELTPVADAHKKITFWKVCPKIVNSGNTSTREMWFTDVLGDFKPASADLKPPGPTPQDLSQATRNRGTIGAHQETDVLLQEPVPSYVMESARNRKTWIYIHGAIIYGDFFTKQTHITRYCYSLWANPGLTGVSGVGYAMCGGRTNCQDEECDAATQEQLKKIESEPN